MEVSKQYRLRVYGLFVNLEDEICHLSLAWTSAFSAYSASGKQNIRLLNLLSFFGSRVSSNTTTAFSFHFIWNHLFMLQKWSSDMKISAWKPQDDLSYISTRPFDSGSNISRGTLVESIYLPGDELRNSRTAVSQIFLIVDLFSLREAGAWTQSASYTVEWHRKLSWRMSNFEILVSQFYFKKCKLHNLKQVNYLLPCGRAGECKCRTGHFPCICSLIWTHGCWKKIRHASERKV